ncbi:MAG: deoxyribonuclease IV [Clostridiales bacterium]|nr:deoxyribonuclease IV [Clostridiales bacterium]
MFRIGYHVSSSGGYLAMGRRAVRRGANTFAYFTRNPRGGAVKALDEKDISDFRSYCEENGVEQIVAHAPYTLNPCAEKENVRVFAKMVLTEDLGRMEYTPGQFYNFHPGSHVGQGMKKGIETIAALLNRVMWPEMRTTVLFETMAGKGSEVGGSFEEIRELLDRVVLGDKTGVCVDTCHVWDAGYDIENDLDGVLREFDRVIGLDRLKAVHLNNSQSPRGARKDRHAKLTEGKISLEAFARIINHPALMDMPFILETPNDEDGYEKEIAMLKEMFDKVASNS